MAPGKGVRNKSPGVAMDIAVSNVVVAGDRQAIRSRTVSFKSMTARYIKREYPKDRFRLLADL